MASVMLNEENIPPLERMLAVLGAMDERIKATLRTQRTTQRTVERTNDKLDAFIDKATAIHYQQNGRLQSLEEDKAQRDRRSALIGAGGGLGGTGIVIAIWQALEAVWRSAR